MNFGWEVHSGKSFDLMEPFEEHFELEVPFSEHSSQSLAVLHQVIKMVPLTVTVKLEFNPFEA